jgi:chemotaxis protein CheX
VEFLIIAPEQSQRATQFQQFLAGQGQSAARIAPGQRVPAAKQCWLGAALFDGGSSREIEEPLCYLGIGPIVVAAATPDADLLQELQARCDIEPISADLRRQLAEPLVTAVQQTLSQMAGAEVIVVSTYQRAKPAGLGDVSVTLTLSQSLEGLLILSFSTSTAEALARRILADVAEQQDPAMVADCMGEIANIIAGQAKALLHGTPNHFVFSTPKVTFAEQGMVFKDGMTSLVIALECEQGAFALQMGR